MQITELEFLPYELLNQNFSPAQMAFFQNRSLSLVDMYIDTSEPTENVGQIQFSLEYNFNESTLILRIMQVSVFLVLERSHRKGGLWGALKALGSS